MAIIGLKVAAAARIKDYEPGKEIEYESGRVFAKAVGANLSWQRINNKFYADDEVAESDNGITGGQFTSRVDDLTDEDEAYLLGFEAGEEGEYIETDDAAPYVGYGYVRVRQHNGERKYQAVHIFRVQFGIQNESTETKGETVAYQPVELTGEIMPVNKDAKGKSKFRAKKTFDDFDEALTWIKNKLNIENDAQTNDAQTNAEV